MKEIRTIAELDEILANETNKLIIVKIGAQWCCPCRMLENTISEIEGTNPENVIFYAVDVDEAETDLLEKYMIQSVPVMLFFNDGLQIDRVVGARGKSDLLALIEKNK